MTPNYKLALIGGKNLAQYTIADQLWFRINKYSSKKFQFSIVPLDTKNDLIRFIDQFRADDSFLGFNVALPWKNEITKYVDRNFYITPSLPLINTVFKLGNEINSFNTDVLGVTKSLDKGFFEKNKKILILGAGGAGFPCGQYIARLNKDSFVFYYTLHPKYEINTSNSKYITSYNELKRYKFDLIINATPLGKLNLNEIPSGFSTPLNFSMLKTIAHSKTIVQDMNYIPVDTLLLELAKELNLRSIPGYYMLVYQALESYKKYFHKDSVDDVPVNLILDEIHLIARKEEKKIMNKKLQLLKE